MTRYKTSLLYRLYRQAKVRLNYLLDRIIDLCDVLLVDAYRLPWPIAQDSAKKIARHVGDISWALRDFPRVSAYKLIGADWTIIFVGRDLGLREICQVFFQEEAHREELGRIALWNLSAQTQKWLAEGVDLVICELSRIHPNRPKAPITFTVPTWINQVLTIPEPPESLISGKKFATERHRLNKAKRLGFDYRFSRSKADLRHYHCHMHLPYVKTRHGHLALVSRSEDKWQRWFVGGGLVLVTQQHKPVAGVLCWMANDTCFDIERGVLEADAQLFKQGIETMITWYGINWARGQGARIYDMGATHAWRSSGSFKAKRRWGARVVERRGMYCVWTVLAQNLSPSLQDYLNKLGFITEMDGRFYGVLIYGGTAILEDTDIHNELLAAQKEGLAGLAITSPNGGMVIHDSVG